MTSFDGRARDLSPGGFSEDIVPFFLDPTEELGDYRDRYAGLARDPAQLLVELRNESDFRIAMARADVRPHLLQWFEEIAEGWQDDGERSGSLGASSVGTSWTFAGLHAYDEAFGGLMATGREVKVRGFTVMTAEEGADGYALKVHRHVDWAGLFGQLGLTVNWRVPLGGSNPDIEES